jgi:DUF4097 and DUF4098 domain-containing protein YvlB
VDVTFSKDSDEFRFDTSGDTDKKVNMNLDHIEVGFIFGGWLDSQNVGMDVGINSDIPIDLEIDTGSGSSVLNLAGMELEKLEADTGSGSINLTAPAGEYPIQLGAGSGSLTIEMAPNANLNMEASVGSGRVSLTLADGVSGQVELGSGSGSITVRVPEGVGVQVSGTTGSGGVHLPGDYVRIKGQDTPGPSESGTWESPGFDSAKDKLYIEFGVGSGSFRLQEN